MNTHSVSLKERLHRRARCLLWLMAITGSSQLSRAVQIEFSIQGLGSLGSPIYLAGDLIDGDGVGLTTIGIAQIISDGMISLSSLTGGGATTASGYAITDASFFNNVTLEVTAAHTLSLVLEANTTGAALGGFPDAFALYFLDGLGLPALQTDEPLGTHALLTLTVTGPNDFALDVFENAEANGVTWNASVRTSNVPEAGTTAAFLGLSFTGLIAVRRWGQLRSKKPFKGNL